MKISNDFWIEPPVSRCTSGQRLPPWYRLSLLLCPMDIDDWHKVNIVWNCNTSRTCKPVCRPSVVGQLSVANCPYWGPSASLDAEQSQPFVMDVCRNWLCTCQEVHTFSSSHFRGSLYHFDLCFIPCLQICRVIPVQGDCMCQGCLRVCVVHKAVWWALRLQGLSSWSLRYRTSSVLVLLWRV